ncbi:riboflavin synthase [Aestuariirhabdus litorea]|uniref:Riboflavin synthase n=1 Tax=Aestuariirhabdus litorea TaxID=2528527 RepID=A0A3P3VNU7_9GAMM|nr:riboflavin synthase [Aestuariirhabdus litorea]RRJ83598.1 riboflavin synthase [Aestuariirhabdus litorea]RWW96819.1 riboflavin synthase [Endozoicomonadaceae bacterium GTF-13]
MFTGIIEAVGRIARIELKGGDLRLCVDSTTLTLDDVKLGDSIATNGVCLTVTGLLERGYWVDVSQETLSCSTLGELSVGAAVNLEKAMQAGGRFGGHMVSGHVDGIGRVLSIRDEGRSLRYRIEPPAELGRYIANKGSITVDGVSLTVNGLEGNSFELNIVPHTAEQTIISRYREGDRVNLEVDLVARYLERLLQGDRSTAAAPGMTQEFLAQHGFRGRGRR